MNHYPHNDFVHVLLTRFNVRTSVDASPPTETWLRSRLAIFEEWTLASVRGQSILPDMWLIYCDASSPSWFRQRLTDLLRENEEIVWIDGICGPDIFAATLAARLPETEYLITTRIDNDDAISRDFIEMVQDQFCRQEKEFINFTRGAQYNSGRFYLRLDPTNAFISLIERCSDTVPVTVFVDMHGNAEKHGAVRRIKSHPAWLQHVHGENIANVIRGIPIRSTSVLAHFSLSISTCDVGFSRLWAEKLQKSFALSIRVIASRHRMRWLLLSLVSSKQSNARALIPTDNVTSQHSCESASSIQVDKPG